MQNCYCVAVLNDLIYLQSDSPVSQFYQFQEILPMPLTSHHTNQHHLQHQTDDGLRRAAGEILSGVRRNVEVQIMHPNDLQAYSILNTGNIKV
jgi:hypothetical protein